MDDDTNRYLDKRALVVGGGHVGLSRIKHLLEGGARVSVVAKEVGPEIERYLSLGLLERLEVREFKINDLQMYETTKRSQLEEADVTTETGRKLIRDFDQCQKFSAVLVSISDEEVSKTIYYRCKQLGIPVNLADEPDHCDFFFGSVYRRGALQIMISSNGRAPRLCNRIKNFKIKPMFEGIDIGSAVGNLGYMRDLIREKKCPGHDHESIEQRMKWNRKVTDFYSIEDWCEMSRSDVDQIVSHFPELPTLK